MSCQQETNVVKMKRSPDTHTHTHRPFRAMTFEAGFMIAESAVMGRLMGFPESERSMMIT